MRLIFSFLVCFICLVSPAVASDLQLKPPIVAGSSATSGDSAPPAENKNQEAKKEEKVKVFAEPAYVYFDEAGKEHIVKRSSVPAKYLDNFSNRHPKVSAIARAARKIAVGWVTPALNLVGAINNI
ncbi:MAG: hypothetical protein LCH63_10395 [Candidatus Melainabacteria bacterium]|nr:hypothetical protein [Candidatus Melainabacteria bacterium]